MKRLALLLFSSVAFAACGGGSPAQPDAATAAVEAPAFAKAAQPATTCASVDANVSSLITLVRNATHVQAPATEIALLGPLQAAHAALIDRPCRKDDALAAMNAFNAAVDAHAGTITASQVIIFHTLANRIIGLIKQVR
jgi:hypothetical protein